MTPTGTDANVKGVQSVMRAVSVLTAFTEQRPYLTVTEVAEIVGLTIPTAHRLLRALTAAEFVVFDRFTKTYSLGSQILRLTNVMLSRDVPSLAYPSLLRLRDEVGETVGLHWMLGERRICVSEAASQQPIRLTSGLGSSYPLTRGAASKAMVSAIPQDAREELITSIDEPLTGKALKRFLREVEEAAERGYATSEGETMVGAAAVAAPIRRVDGGLGAINVTGPATRFTRQKLEAAVEPLLAETGRIQRLLGVGER